MYFFFLQICFILKMLIIFNKNAIFDKYLQEINISTRNFSITHYKQISDIIQKNASLRKKCPYTELFLVRIFLYSE